MTPEKESIEAQKMWAELESSTATEWSRMNECHEIEKARMEEDFIRCRSGLESELSREKAENKRLGKMSERQRRKIDWLWMALTAIGLFASYLAKTR